MIPMHPPFVALLQCQAAHTLPDSDSRAVDQRVLPPAANGSNSVAQNLTDAPSSPYIPPAGCTLTPRRGLGLGQQ